MAEIKCVISGEIKNGVYCPKSCKRMMGALDYLKSIPHLPHSVEHGKQRPSNSEIYRWLKSGSVIINGERPQPNDEIELPVNELVFFPSAKRKTTYASL